MALPQNSIGIQISIQHVQSDYKSGASAVSFRQEKCFGREVENLKCETTKTYKRSRAKRLIFSAKQQVEQTC